MEGCSLLQDLEVQPISDKNIKIFLKESLLDEIGAIYREQLVL